MRNEPRRRHIHATLSQQKYGPKGPLSPTLGTPCGICDVAFAVGDYTTLARPETDTEQHRYSDASVEVHWACAHPIDALEPS